MKKSLLALAVMGALAGSASAQQASNVTIYGLMDLTVSHLNVSGPNGGSVTGMEEGNNGAAHNGSKIGFKGSEDLGGGLSTVFQLEGGFASDTGKSTQGGALFGRTAMVGLQSNSWGTLSFGRQVDPMYLALDLVDPFDLGHLGNVMGGIAGYTASAPARAGLAGLAGTAVGKAGLAALGTSITTAFNSSNGISTLWPVGTEKYVANSIQYQTPFLNGFVGVAQYGFGEQANNFGANSSFNFTGYYFHGPLTLTASYGHAKGQFLSDPAAAPSARLGELSKSWLVGGSYDFKVAKLDVALGGGTDSVPAGSPLAAAGAPVGDFQKQRTYMVGGTVPLTGGLSLLGSWTRYNDRADWTQGLRSYDQYALGVNYDLSKRTALYADVGYAKFRGNKDVWGNLNANGIQLGIDHKF
jgi:predicted porin